MAADSLNRRFVYANRDVMLPDYGAGEATEQQVPLLPGERPYGARSEESVVVGDLLMRHVPALARGDLEIVAIARHQTVLSKVAVRRRRGIRLTARPVSLVVGLGADYEIGRASCRERVEDCEGARCR